MDLFSKKWHGEGTYYGEGADSGGICGFWTPPGGKGKPFGGPGQPQFTVAINKPDYFGGKSCGMCVKIWGTGAGSGADPIRYNGELALVNNICPECKSGDLDLALSKDGRWDISYQAVPCPTEGNVEFVFVGSHQWYLKVQPRNVRFPVQEFEIVGKGKGRLSPDDYFFVFTGNGPYNFPLTVKMTAASGEVLTQTIQRFANNQAIPGQSQFSGGGDSGGGASSSSSTTAVTPRPTLAPTLAPTSPATASSVPSEMKDLLRTHNIYRCMHNVPAMTWEPEIQKLAQAWADYLPRVGKLMHGGMDQYPPGRLGQNLAYGANDAGSVKMWYDEIQYTNNGLVNSFGSKTGHYTQVVWKESTKLGCGKISRMRLVVCDYFPAGNMRGQFTQNVLRPVKSQNECQQIVDSGGSWGAGSAGGAAASTPVQTRAPTIDRSKCTPDWGDCINTKCCKNASYKCYSKYSQPWYAQCAPRCPGSPPSWTCEVLTPR